MSPVDGDGAAAVYAATGDGRVLCLDVEAGSVVSEFHGHTGTPRQCVVVLLPLATPRALY